ncbi:hypothetical protein LTR35_005056 [Friedmanniomyces endolithicus]|uniref:Spindle pole body-associated protein cut12 domain-containing protein n=1 Tax=Friedmanniomyces endolithicus TaxID=329885 RepID=A0AAN6G6T7_9PEZI|nr:hypothetical protein LTR35_005056 [Friedmanniomyces endolithicus]KAK0298809.1 hypothetical protein LTS00_002571 [Friedmanniomyces endolithicus]KAK0328801.1 hypothetical protein LTR82_000734 [Friedmanniomyces endolithicus]KAK1003972.1 hypothetical protein LTR54_007736 [Friedmanniomyces endolithicus]
MLHWLAGSKAPEGPTDPDATGYIEAPETPAPVFAVRAFKQAIFGTPQTVQPKPRRHSNNDNARLRPHGSRPDRPYLTRPRSAENALRLAELDECPVVDPIASPTKGILMTPGTAATKRKTVTFGEHVADNEAKRLTKTGLPDDCPGKFPSPWTKTGATLDLSAAPVDTVRGRSKLTEALEQARDESAKPGAKAHKRNKIRDEDENAGKPEEPLAESALYWKTQYDVYRDNSQREIKKLITKQKAAKSFAKEKDWQCTELADELRQERKKVDILEKAALELETQLLMMREQLKQSQGVQRGPSGVLTDPRPDERDSRRISPPTTGSLVVAQVPVTELAKAVAVTKQELLSTETQVESVGPSLDIGDKPNPSNDVAKPMTRARPVNVRTKTTDDIWNQSINSSSPIFTRSGKGHGSPKAGRAVTSGTGATPLMSLNVNALPTTSVMRRDSAQPSPPSDRFAKEPLVRQEVVRPPQLESKPKESPELSPALPQPSPEPESTVPQAHTPRKRAIAEASDATSMPLPASSPIRPSPVLSSPEVGTKKSYFDRMAVDRVKITEPPALQEPAPSTTKAKPLSSENIKPTAAWNAINAPNVGKRVTSLTDKSGKEVGLDRIEAAKARVAARGRVLS